MARTNTSTGGGGGGVTGVNGLTGAVTLSAGSNVTLTETGQDISVSANFTQEGKYMISGGITWSGTGLTYDVSFLEYFFNGNKTANPTQITLAASDPTNNRFDAIVVDEAGTITAITGTASANPEVPAIPEDQLQVTIILVAAGSVTPTVVSEEIYMDDPTTGWTFSTYQTAAPTGSINFAGTSSPKQGIECLQASTDARLGARFVRSTAFDAYQYTMLQVWVRFTGTAVATNKALNVRFENSAGTLVANTVNLFNYGLQRGVLNTWQLVVVPITAFGALPATVKGLKIIMAGGTVGAVRQWDLDYMILTNGSVPYANVPTIAFYKDSVGIASQSGLNLIEGLGGATIDALNNPIYNRVDYTVNAFGGDALSYRDEATQQTLISTDLTVLSGGFSSSIASIETGLLAGGVLGAGVGLTMTDPNDATLLGLVGFSVGGLGTLNSLSNVLVKNSGAQLSSQTFTLDDTDDGNGLPFYELTVQDTAATGSPRKTINIGGSSGLFRFRSNDQFQMNAPNGLRLGIGNTAIDWYSLPATAGTTGYVLTAQGDGAAATWEPAAGGSPGGANTQVQFNNSGSFDGNSFYTFDSSGGFRFGGNSEAEAFLQQTGNVMNYGYNFLNQSISFLGSGIDSLTVGTPSGIPETYEFIFKGQASYTEDVNATITGVFQNNETITGGTSGATAKFISYLSDATGTIYLYGITGTFTVGETVTGAVSGATFVVGAGGIITYPTTDGFAFIWNLDGGTYTSNIYEYGDGFASIGSITVIMSGVFADYVLDDTYTITYAIDQNLYGKFDTATGGSISWGDINNEFLGSKIKIGITSGITSIGDVDNIGSGTKITIDTVNEIINFANIPAYNSEADAVTAGLVTGDIWQTTALDPQIGAAGFLRIIP